MKLDEILKLDCQEKANKKLLMEKLLETKPFQEYEKDEITFNLIEKKYRQLIEKCYVKINMIMPSAHTDHYTAFLKDWLNDKNLPLCYGLTMQELYMKSFIYIYNLVKKNPSLRRENKDA